MAIHLRLERVERGAEGLELARLAMDLLVAWYKGPGSEVGLEVGLKVGSRVSLSAKPSPNFVGGVA